MFFSLTRYLTSSYGTGQDIDERIVEGEYNELCFFLKAVFGHLYIKSESPV